jgi:hypothetical protein
MRVNDALPMRCDPKNRQLSPRVRVFIDWLVEVVSPKL